MREEILKQLRLMTARRAALMQEEEDGNILNFDEDRELTDLEFNICEAVCDLIREIDGSK